MVNVVERASCGEWKQGFEKEKSLMKISGFLEHPNILPRTCFLPNLTHSARGRFSASSSPVKI